MILAELNVWHSRPAVPTRRVALGDDKLPFDPSPGSGGLLLAAVVAAHAQQLDDDGNVELTELLNVLEISPRIPQPRLKHRLQRDRIGLTRSTHRLVSLSDGNIALDLAPSHRPEPHVLAALYRASHQPSETRSSLFTLLRSARRWRGGAEGDLLRYLIGEPSEVPWNGQEFVDPVTWALEVLGFSPQSTADLPDTRQVRRTFRRMLRNAHPDHGGVPSEAGRRIEALTAARNILLDRRSA